MYSEVPTNEVAAPAEVIASRPSPPVPTVKRTAPPTATTVPPMVSPF